MTIAERLLQNSSLNEFKEKYYRKEPFAAPLTAWEFRDLLSWNLLEEVVSDHNDCWLPKEGHLPSCPSLCTGRLSSHEVRRGFAEGRTILVRHSEKAHPAFEQIANDFQYNFQGSIDIQLYYTPSGQQGFNWHYDLEEVFVIQSVGSKEFRLRKNTVSTFPLNIENWREDWYKETSGPEIRCLLEPGDWLYIPSGYWHTAHAVTNSAHLSVGVLAREVYC